MKAVDLCDLCGSEVPPDQGFRGELSAPTAMCPTPMAFHDECWEKASALWQPDADSLCSVDPLFPETGQWTTPPPPQS